MDYLSFKSGTDIRGIACEGVEGEHVNLTDEAVAAMTAGFLCWFKNHTDKQLCDCTISLGHDSRVSAERIKSAVSAVLVKCGVTVLDCGLSSTPAMFMTTVDYGCDAAIQLTASHHPFNRNGLKFFTPNGGLEGSDITEILTYANNGEYPEHACGGKVEKIDYMSRYAEILRGKIIDGVGSDMPLKGFHIVVDAGNGAGGFYAENV
ncbi:MAG: phosphomannomutase/phosphoglucomutase, partial [Acutalibacteraceae bacterium]|nr:phosphomannomutase/phosphoglucomutase [Acutalibacteraceae bacterium]